MQWVGVLYSDQNKITQNHRTKLRLEGTSGVIPPQVEDFPFAFVDVHSKSNLDLISTPKCTTCDQHPVKFLAGPNSSSGFQPTLLSIYPVCILSFCLWWTWTNSLAKVRTDSRNCSSLTHRHCGWFPTHISVLVPQKHPALCMFGNGFHEDCLHHLLGDSGEVDSDWFKPVLTSADWMQLDKTGKNQFQPVMADSDWLKPVPGFSNWYWIVPTDYDWLWPVQTNSEPVGTSLSGPELIGASLNWFKPVRTGLNQFGLVRTGLKLLEPGSTTRNWSELVLPGQKQFEPVESGLNCFELV